jgi:hypothetical protein
MTMKISLLTCTAVFLLSTSAIASPDKDAINAAEKAQNVAASVGYEWRDTAKMIQQAKKLSEQGKVDEAIQLARQAEEQGKDAYAQYQYEKSRYVESH